MNLSDWKHAVKERDGYLCVQCGSNDRPNAHHIVPLGIGGLNTLDNGRTLCHTCHRATHSDKLSTSAISAQRKLLPGAVVRYSGRHAVLPLDDELYRRFKVALAERGMTISVVGRALIAGWIDGQIALPGDPEPKPPRKRAPKP